MTLRYNYDKVRIMKKYKYITISAEERLALETVILKIKENQLENYSSVLTPMIEILSKLLSRSKHQDHAGRKEK